VTGGYVGVGFELGKLLYQKNGTVYVAGRSPEKASKAIEDIKSAFPGSNGKLEFLQLDLADLTTIKKSAEEFLFKEQRLDVLWNNAGVMMPPIESKTAQGYELQMGTNCLGPYLFTQLLHPILKKTAASAPANSVRVAWAGSLAIDLSSPKGGVEWDASGSPKASTTNKQYNYAVSKLGNLLLASEFARRTGGEGIISVAFNPGNLRTSLARHMPGWWEWLVVAFLAYDPIYGAYTELFAGLSPDITAANNGAFVIPWGRLGPVRTDIVPGLRTQSEGGNGTAAKFWEYCDTETKKYV